MGFKDWGAWHLVQDFFTNKGYAFCKFNLSHNGGTVENGIDFPDAGNDNEISKSEECFEHSEQSSDDDMKEDDQKREDDHAKAMSPMRSRRKMKRQKIKERRRKRQCAPRATLMTQRLKSEQDTI